MAVDFITDFVSNLGVDFSNPIGLAINIILSTIIGGIVLLVIVEIVGKKDSIEIKPTNAFLAVLLINIINLPFITAFILPLISFVPFVPMLLPLLVWIMMIKLLFRGMPILHAIIVGVVGYALSIFLIPYLVALAGGYLPL